ncbi:MAG: RNA polymerase sigma factor [Bacteroidia bacterium]|nr:RNA polymerase sigma factor [Bacteroidia bacterium]HQU99884.1 RNA polymerase sigma factor [Bacteroidia bacterium]
MDEQQLVTNCLKGDKTAQKQFYEMFARKMMGVCLRYSNDLATAEDYLQESFIKVFGKLSQYQFKGSLEGWVKRIVVNVVLDELRKNRILFDSNAEVTDVLQTTDDVVSNMEAKQLLQIIQRLPTGYRTVFNLYAIEGYQHNEIANMLQISESTSKSQYQKAKIQIQKTLKAQTII